MPAYGEKVQVAGEKRTDSYCWNLVRAIWCPNPAVPWTPAPARETTAEEILSNGRRSPHGINPQWHGRLVRICGHVVGVSYERSVATLQCEHETVSVDVSACLGALDELREGATVAVTGTVVFDVPNWRRGEPFPRIRGMTLVPRGVNDVTVLSAPPWWTPARILLLAALVVLVLAGFGLRERIRKRLAQEPKPGLTERQLEILAAAVKGYTNREIGDLLGLKPQSVKEHLSNVYAKLGAANRSEAVRIAVERRIIG